MLQNCDGSWFAIRVRPKAEQAVVTALRCKEYEVYFPTYRCTRQWSDRVKTFQLPLFAGYLFCRFNPVAPAAIVTTPGVLQILGIGSKPVAIDDSEILSLRAVESCNGIRFYPWPKLEVGAQVCIRDGPLRGLVGVLRLIKNEHAFILAVPLLQRSVAVEIQADWVAPASRTPAALAMPHGGP